MTHSRTGLKLATVLFGILTVAAATHTDVPMLLPGDRDLVSKSVGGDSAAMNVTLTDARGTTRQFGKVSLYERAIAGRTDAYMAIRHGEYTGYLNDDSLVVRRSGLIPETETLALPKATSRFTYAGAHVTAVIEKADSAPVTKDLTYPQPVFAFNQMESIARSLPFKDGYSRVVPLFSESDLAVEYDTLTVLGKARTPAGRDAWRVRFADPVIMMELLIESASRRIVSQAVTYRGRPGGMTSTRE